MVLLDGQLDWIERHLGDWKNTLPRVCSGSVTREGGHVGQPRGNTCPKVDIAV